MVLHRRWRGWPLGWWSSVVALQEEATNHPRAAAVKSRGGERCGKRRAFERVRYDPMKANESEPQMKCRKEDDIETELRAVAPG